MRQLPLLTILVLVVGILAWNFSFYGEFYRARSTGLPVRAEGPAQMRSINPGQVGEPVISFRAETGEMNGVEGDSAYSSVPDSDQRAPAGTDTQPGPELAQVAYDYPDGGPKSVGWLRDGDRHGLWTEYWENGKTLMAGKFVQGERCGEWKFFHEARRAARGRRRRPAAEALPRSRASARATSTRGREASRHSRTSSSAPSSSAAWSSPNRDACRSNIVR